jgi:hypothetical protein
MMTRALMAALLLASPAWAAEPMTGAEFRAFTEGHTLHVEDETGEYFGSEQYIGDNGAIWLPGEGECQKGVWAEVKDKICFLYDSGDLSCWRIFRDGATSMRFQSVPAYDDEENEAPEAPVSLFLRLTKRDKRPIICPEGPGV